MNILRIKINSLPALMARLRMEALNLVIEVTPSAIAGDVVVNVASCSATHETRAAFRRIVQSL